MKAVLLVVLLVFAQAVKVVGPVKIVGPVIVNPQAGAGGTPSFVQEVVGRCANATDVNCVTTTATFTVASTGSNHYATAQFWDNAGTGITPSSGTNCSSGWQFKTNMNQSSGPIGDISGGFCQTLTSGVTSIAFTFSASVAGDFAGRVTERSCSSGTPTYDVSGSTSGGSSVTSFGTQLLTGLSGNNSIDQMLALSGTPGSPSVGAPYNTNMRSTDTSGGGGLGAILVSRIENVTSDTSATWTWTGAEFPFSQAISVHC